MKTPVFLFTLALCASAQSPRAIPIDNDQVRVLDVTSPAHEKTRLHEHKVNRVMVYLQEGRQDFEYEGGKKSTLEWKAGQALWSPAAGMHTAEIVSNKPVRIIEIELKKRGAGKSATGTLDPVQVDPKHYHVEFENDQVRVVRVKIGPKETAPMHQHNLNRVVVYLTDQNFKVTSADGKVDNPQHKAGEVSWGPPAKHTETNVSSKPFEVVVVDLKG